MHMMRSSKHLPTRSTRRRATRALRAPCKGQLRHWRRFVATWRIAAASRGAGRSTPSPANPRRISASWCAVPCLCLQRLARTGRFVSHARVEVIPAVSAGPVGSACGTRTSALDARLTERAFRGVSQAGRRLSCGRAWVWEGSVTGATRDLTPSATRNYIRP